MAKADTPNTYVLPDEIEAATKYVFEKIKKLKADRRWIASRARDIVQAAKAANYTTSAARKAMHLRSMTPERREKFLADMRTAAALFGVEISDPGAIEEKRDKLWGFVEQAQFLRAERKENAELMAELRGVVKDYNTVLLNRVEDGSLAPEEAQGRLIDFKHLETLVHIQSMSEDERTDWFFRLDKAGVRVGFW